MTDFVYSLMQWLWNDAQYRPDYPNCSMPFFADDVVYEDMIYKDPFVGREAVEKMLRKISPILLRFRSFDLVFSESSSASERVS